MDNLLNFVSKYYIVFIIISAVLILALIGYIADKKTKEDIIIKKGSIEELIIAALKADLEHLYLKKNQKEQ